MKNIEIKIFLTIFLLFISALIFSEDSEECRRDKPFIDLWDTICPDDWVPLFPLKEASGEYWAPRSLLRIPDVKIETRPEDIELVIFWIYEYDANGLFGSDYKAAWTNYYAECNKKRYKMQDIHVFSDISAKNKVGRSIGKADDWIPMFLAPDDPEFYNPFPDLVKLPYNFHVNFFCGIDPRMNPYDP